MAIKISATGNEDIFVPSLEDVTMDFTPILTGIQSGAPAYSCFNDKDSVSLSFKQIHLMNTGAAMSRKSMLCGLDGLAYFSL